MSVGKGLKAAQTEEDHGGVWEVPVEVRFDNTSLQRLVEFLYAVNTAKDAMMDVRELDVSVRGRNVGAMNGKMVHAQLNARNKFSSRQRGQLRNSIRVESKTSATGAVAEISPHTIYARIQEFGGIIYPRRASMLHWKDENGEDHFAKSVTIPARPYLRPAAEDHIDQISDVMRQAVEDGIKHNS